MAWVKFTDDFDESPKFDHVGALGMAMWVAGMAYCNRKRTDGAIHRLRALRLIHFDDITYAGSDEPAELIVGLLIEAGLWHAEGHDCPRCPQPKAQHYIVHDYLDYQPSKESLDTKAAEEAERKAAWRAKQKGATAERPDDVPTGQTVGHPPDDREASQEASGAGPAVSPDPPVPGPVPVPEPSSKDSRNASRSSSDKSDNALPAATRFDEFWDVYGNKTGKKASIEVYRRALKKRSVTEDLIIAAATEYAAWCSQTGTYKKNPLTWLRGEHWTDELSGREARTGSRLQKNLQVVEQLRAQEQGTTPPEIGPST